MDLNETAVFVKVVQAGSFSAAARLLGLPTSTVSTRVARLEKRLGVTLLQRTTRRLNLTEPGQRYYEHAATGLSHMLDAESAVSESISEAKGLLRITAPVDVGDLALAEIASTLRARHPLLNVEMVLLNRYVDLIAEGIDVAIRTGPLKDSSLIARKVGVARWVAFASPTYLKTAPPITSPQALRHHACLQFTPMGKDAWTFQNGKNAVTVPLSGQVMINDIRIIQSMAIAGQGVALLPDFRQHECAAGQLIQVLPKWHAREDPIHIVYPRQRYVSPKLRAFVDIAHEILSKLFKGPR